VSLTSTGFMTTGFMTSTDDVGFAPIDVSVLHRGEAADGVITLDLAAADGGDLPGWSAGAHVDVDIPDTGLVRQYSLCGPVGASFWRIAVLLEPESRGGSSWLHRNAVEGVTLRIIGLRNHFAFSPEGPVVLVAGGIGITPLIPMIAEAGARGLPWELHYAGRSADSMAFVAELAGHGDRVELYRPGTRRLDVRHLVERCAPGTVIYACGPDRLLAAVEAEAAHGGLAVRTERFAGAQIDTSQDAAFDVSCARSGARVRVPADRSILAVLGDAGIQQMSQCEEGVCGSCETAVLDGIPEHRDVLLTDEERDENTVMMICVSRAKTPHLVLDL
jgi:ferredoxin-NADP reductase